MEIQLTQGKVALVDDRDAWLTLMGKWHAVRMGKLTERWYAMRVIEGKTIYMHRLIMRTPKGMDTDHINGDGLDNRRENLRIVTRSQNMANAHAKPKRGKTSQYKGVSLCTVKNVRGNKTVNYYWKAEIELPGRKRISKLFHEEVDAARHYNAMALQYRGSHAKLNVIAEDASCAATS